MNAKNDGTAELRQAWDDYQATLAEMRGLIESTDRFKSHPESRNKAYHVLFEIQAIAYNYAIAPRMENPRIYRNLSWQSDVYTMGQNCPDFVYGISFLDGKQTYRMKGSVANCQMFAMQVLSGVFGDPNAKCISNTNMEDLKLSAGKEFEINFSAKEQPGHWVKLVEDCDFQIVFVRRAFKDWHAHQGDLRIERVSEVAAGQYDADEFDPSAMARRVRRASDVVRYLATDFAVNLYDLYIKFAGGKLNAMGLIPGTASSEMGSPACLYAMGSFKLADDEAMIVKLDKLPDGPYWSYQLGDVWSRSLDYAGRMTSINDLEASVDGDGAVRVVVAHKDPGFKNWLDTCGRKDAVIVLRNYGASVAQTPDCQVVKFNELADLMPKSAACVSPEERRKIIKHRLDGQRKMLGE